MAEEQNADAAKSEPKLGNVDGWFSKIVGYTTTQISRFVAFLFLLFFLGAVYGLIVAGRDTELKTYLIIAPAVLGLIAYYDRGFAVLLFILLIVFFVIL